MILLIVALSALVLTATPFIILALCVLFIFNERSRYARCRNVAENEVNAAGEKVHVITLGIFHPYANSGGGGERVMYCILSALVEEFNRLVSNKQQCRLQIILYAGDDGLNMAELINRASEHFNLPTLKSLNVLSHVKLVKIPNRHLLEPDRYPRFTLLWQAIAHIRVAVAAFRASAAMGYYPKFWIDTTGCPFAYLVASIRYGCSVVTYVHYPMISVDMIRKIQNRVADYNNSPQVASSPVKSKIKSLYYFAISIAYGAVGKYCTDVVMVNSSWTYNHIKKLWKKSPILVYPPCGIFPTTEHVASLRPLSAISIAQFRSEKNHILQLEAVNYLFKNDKFAKEMHSKFSNFKLYIIGCCRNEEDEHRVALLQEKCQELQLNDYIQFIVNASVEELQLRLQSSAIGLHTMYKEHFGISIVEMMAAGVIVIANKSGGPESDIIKHGSGGFLALTAEEYATQIFRILHLSDEEQQNLRYQAQLTAKRFSDSAFTDQFIAALPINQIIPRR